MAEILHHLDGAETLQIMGKITTNLNWWVYRISAINSYYTNIHQQKKHQDFSPTEIIFPPPKKKQGIFVSLENFFSHGKKP